jgi:chromosome partitioning protein
LSAEAKPDYLSTLGIDYLKRNLSDLVQEFNNAVKIHGRSEQQEIGPRILSVVFTMIQLNAEQPISLQRQYIKQTKDLNVPVFEWMYRENKTLFGEAPESGIPVVLTKPANPTYKAIVAEIDAFVDEFIAKAGVTPQCKQHQTRPLLTAA